MSILSRRNLMIGALAATAGAATIALARSGASANGYEHLPLNVAEMEASGGLIVDIRTPPEWHQTGVIDGAKLVEFNFDKPATFLPQIADDIADGRDLVLICRSGNRTQAVGDFLAGQIPNRIVSVRGGIKRVISEGYKTVPPA